MILAKLNRVLFIILSSLFIYLFSSSHFDRLHMTDLICGSDLLSLDGAVHLLSCGNKIDCDYGEWSGFCAHLFHFLHGYGIASILKGHQLFSLYPRLLLY